MPEWSKFTDSDINKIKHHLESNINKLLVLVLKLSPIIILIAPIIPNGARAQRMIDRMPYWDAVLQLAIIWPIVLTLSLLWNYYYMPRQLAKHRKFLRKRKLSTNVTGKSKSLFSLYENKLITDLEAPFHEITIEKELIRKINEGDKIEIEYEEHTKTILAVELLK